MTNKSIFFVTDQAGSLSDASHPLHKALRFIANSWKGYHHVRPDLAQLTVVCGEETPLSSLGQEIAQELIRSGVSVNSTVCHTPRLLGFGRYPETDPASDWISMTKRIMEFVFPFLFGAPILGIQGDHTYPGALCLVVPREFMAVLAVIGGLDSPVQDDAAMHLLISKDEANCFSWALHSSIFDDFDHLRSRELGSLAQIVLNLFGTGLVQKVVGDAIPLAPQSES